MPLGAAIGAAAGSIGGALISSNAATQAANVQAKAADKATALQQKTYEQTRTDLAPYRGVGEGATYSLADLYGLPTPSNPNGGQPFGPESIAAFERSPDYQFALDQGIKARDRSASKNGLLLSGGQLKAITDYGQGLATQNFGNYANRLMQLADLGGNAAARTGSIGAQSAAGQANTTLAGGEAQASGIVGSANALNTGIGQLFNNGAFYSGITNPSSYGSIANYNLNPNTAGFY